MLDIAVGRSFQTLHLGFWCGERNGLTVVDIDSPADAELQYAHRHLRRHARHRADGERQGIMPTIAMPASVGASGPTRATLSTSWGRAALRSPRLPNVLQVAGTSFCGVVLIDLRRLPTIKRGAVVEPVTVPQTRKPVGETADVVATIGQRNNTMFRLACALAQTADDRDALLAQVRAANSAQSMPVARRRVAEGGGQRMAIPRGRPLDAPRLP